MEPTKILCLRITLADEPGALARVTQALAAVGGNIVDIDVHGVHGTTAVDDVTVAVPRDVSPMHVRAQLLEAGALSVVSTGDHHRTSDTAVRSLEAAAALLEAEGPVLDALPRIVVALTAADSADVVPHPHDAIEHRAVATATPVQTSTDDHVHVLVLPIQQRGTTVLRVSRRGQQFSAAEVTRLRVLMRIVSACTPLGAAAG